MAVETHKLDILFRESLPRDFRRKPRFDGGAEFGIHPAGADFLMCVRIDAGRDAQKNLLTDAGAAGVLVDAFQLLHAVHDKVSDSALYGVFDVEIRLIVAVEKGAFHRKSRGHRREKFSGGNDIGAHALVCHNPVNLLEAERLGGIKRKGALAEIFFHGDFIFAAALAHPFVVDEEERRAVFFRQRDGIRAGK